MASRTYCRRCGSYYDGNDVAHIAFYGHDPVPIELEEPDSDVLDELTELVLEHNVGCVEGDRSNAGLCARQIYDAFASDDGEMEEHIIEWARRKGAGRG